MTISGLTKRKGGKTTLAQLLENKIGGKKRRRSTTTLRKLDEQHLTKALLQSKKKTKMFVADRLATLAVTVASRIDYFLNLFWNVLKLNKKKQSWFVICCLHTYLRKKIQQDLEERRGKKHCIKVETLVVITQHYWPYTRHPFQENKIFKNSWRKLCVKGFALPAKANFSFSGLFL